MTWERRDCVRPWVGRVSGGAYVVRMCVRAQGAELRGTSDGGACVTLANRGRWPCVFCIVGVSGRRAVGTGTGGGR
jgi:hypothetical protein